MVGNVSCQTWAMVVVAVAPLNDTPFQVCGKRGRKGRGAGEGVCLLGHYH